MTKSRNRKLLIRVQLVKILFYPFIILLAKSGLINIFYKSIEKIVRIFGIEKSINSFLQYRNFTKLFKHSFVNHINGSPTIIFPTFLGVNSNFTLFILLLAKFYLRKGFSPVILACNASVPVCQKENFLRNRKFNPFFCHECYSGYRSLSEGTGINIVYLSQLKDTEIIQKINESKEGIIKLNTIEDCTEYCFGDIPVGKIASKSVLRYFLKGSFTGESKEINIYRKFLLTVVELSLLYDKYFKSISSGAKAIIPNGTLAQESLFRLFCSRTGTGYITYENYMGSDTVIYKKNDEVMKLNWQNELRQYDFSKVSNSDLEERVSQFFSELKIGKHKYAVLNKGSNPETGKKYGRYACAFTNLNFDTAVIGKHTIFKDMEDWLCSLVDYWEGIEYDIRLVIRIHPAEIKMRTGTKEFMGDKIQRRIRSDKIVLIDSTDTVSSYDLLESMEYGLIYSSTIGIEIANMNKPCIVAGKPYFINQPFVITPAGKPDYFNIINQLNRKVIDFIPDRDSLIRMIYYYFLVRLKHLKGVTIFSLNSEQICYYDDPDRLVDDNLDFLNEFNDELLGD